MIPRDNIHKLFDLFVSKCEEFMRQNYNAEEPWIEYLSSIGCSCLPHKEIMYEFCLLVNEERCLKTDVICIPDPFAVSRSEGHKYVDGDSDARRLFDCDYVLIPKDFALKVLVLGEMP